MSRNEKFKRKLRLWSRKEDNISHTLKGAKRMPGESFDNYKKRRKAESIILNKRLKYGMVYWDSLAMGQLVYSRDSKEE